MYGKNGIRQVIQMHPKDNVLVALTDLPQNEDVIFEGETFVLQNTIKAKHKFYTTDLKVFNYLKIGFKL